MFVVTAFSPSAVHIAMASPAASADTGRPRPDTTQCADTPDSPRPLRDPYAARPAGSSLFGFYGNSPHGRPTRSSRAVAGSDAGDPDRDPDDVVGRCNVLICRARRGERDQTDPHDDVVYDGPIIRLQLDRDASVGQLWSQLKEHFPQGQHAHLQSTGKLVLLGVRSGTYHLGDAYLRIMLEEPVAAALAEGNNEVSFKLVLVRGP